MPLLYIDPGAGTMGIQAVIAMLIAIPFFFRAQVARVLQQFRELRGRGYDESSTDS